MKNGNLRKILMTPLGKLLPKHSEKEANHHLTQLILQGGSFMAARFGATEIKAMLYSLLPCPINLVFRERALCKMELWSGFFSANDKTLRRFADLMLTV